MECSAPTGGVGGLVQECSLLPQGCQTHLGLVLWLGGAPLVTAGARFEPLVAVTCPLQQSVTWAQWEMP